MNSTSPIPSPNNLTPIKKKIKFEPKFLSLNDLNLKYNADNYLNTATEDVHLRLKNYLSIPNTILDERKRYILLDWMLELSSSLYFKRSTYHLSSVLVDMYLSTVINVKIEELQLIGVTCLLIASKNEEIETYSIKFFSSSTKNTYSVNMIMECEQKILKSLGWKIQVPHLAEWGNLVMAKWDAFSEEKKYSLPKFRGSAETNYYLFKNFFMLLDVISLDYYHIFINEKLICNSIIFLLIGQNLECFSMNDILNCFESENLNTKFYRFIGIFTNFLKEKFDLTFEQLRETVKYVCMFFYMTFVYEDTKYQTDSEEEKNQIQTRNEKNQESIKRIMIIRKNGNDTKNSNE